MAVHPSILAWKSFMDRGAWWATAQRIGHDWVTAWARAKYWRSGYSSQLRCSLPEPKEITFCFIAQLPVFFWSLEVTFTLFFLLFSSSKGSPSVLMFFSEYFKGFSHVFLKKYVIYWRILQPHCQLYLFQVERASDELYSAFFTLLLLSDGVVCLWRACAISQGYLSAVIFKVGRRMQTQFISEVPLKSNLSWWFMIV